MDDAEDATSVENEGVLANTGAREHFSRRDRDISSTIHGVESWSDKVNALLGTIAGDRQDPAGDKCHCDDPDILSSLASSKPFEETILAIVWELCNSKFCATLLEPWGRPLFDTLDNFISLLSAAAAYEIKSNSKVVRNHLDRLFVACSADMNA